jgi:dienelactone hydrolase
MSGFTSKTVFLAVRKYSKRLIYGLLIIIPVVILAFWGYSEFTSYSPDKKAYDMALSTENVKIEERQGYFAIIPLSIKSDSKPLIFYPGGLVKPQSYLLKMVKISLNTSAKVFLIKSPFNLAFFDVSAANRIIEENNLTQPILAGHSLGGVAACRFLRDNPDKVSGIYLYGSYCDQSIAGFKGTVLSVIGQNDQILNKESYNKAKPNLPTQTVFREIPDLNHSSFGDYGLQKGDGVSGLKSEDVVKVMSID